MANLNYIFLVGDINYRCKIPECESTDESFIPEWWPNADIDRCSKPILNLTLYAATGMCFNETFTLKREKCTEWVYENNNTIITKLNLGCQLWKQNMIGTVHAIGIIVALLFSGWFTDRCGRKISLVLFATGAFTGTLKVFANSYGLYLALEFLEAVISGGVFATGAVLKSVRWQILHGKIDEAKKTLAFMSKMNNADVNIHEIEALNEFEFKKLFTSNDTKNREGFMDVLKSPEILKRFVMSMVGRFTVSFIYYSLLVNSVYLPGNKYTNFLLAAFASFPGELLSLYLMKKLGRKLPLFGGFLVSGFASITSYYIPEEHTWAKVVVFLIGKLVTSAAFTGIIIYNMELFPTSVRGSLLSLCTLSSCLGNVIAPLIPTLIVLSPLLPPVCYGCSSLASFGLLFLTPETSNLPLPATIKDIENINSENTNATKYENSTGEYEMKGLL